ncbi:hypothetical protein D3C84_960030 [compost metagenome]
MHLVGNSKDGIINFPRQPTRIKIHAKYKFMYTKRCTSNLIYTNQVINVIFESPSGTKIKKGLALQGLFFRL